MVSIECMPCFCVVLAYMPMYFADTTIGTIQFELENWQNKSWGLHNIERELARCESAISSDGSRMNRCDIQNYQHYFVTTDRRSFHHLYLKQPHQMYGLDHDKRVARGGDCNCTWKAELEQHDDAHCSRAASVHYPQVEYAGTGRIAEQAVVFYQSAADQEPFHRVAFAPGLACEVMERSDRWKGTFGIPGAQKRYRVTSYTPGEPDKSLFAIPAGYHIEKGHP